MSYLVLIRHGESEWNKAGFWTGWTDISLSDKGREEAKQAGQKLQGLNFNIAFTSPLVRAVETLDIIKKELGVENLPTETDHALNERNYGIYTGKNKWQLKEDLGERKFLKIRRGWDEKIPEGETLKDVYLRVVPYYEQNILPKIKEGKNVLVSAHGNSLRAFVKFLENISDEEIPNLEIATGEIYIYQMDESGNITSKEIKKVA